MKKFVSSLLIFQLLMLPVVQAKESMKSQREAEKALLAAIAEMAVQIDDPMLESPLAKAALEQNYIADITQILSVQTYIEEIHINNPNVEGPIIRVHNGSDEKFRKVARRLALEQALKALFFHSTLLGNQKVGAGLTPEVQSSIRSEFPGLFQTLSSWGTGERVESIDRAQLLDSTAVLLIKKGFEIGALVEQSTKLKELVAQIDAALPDSREENRPALLKNKERYSHEIFALDVEVDRRLSEESAFSFLTIPIQPSGSDKTVPLLVYLRSYHNQHLVNLRGLEVVDTRSPEYKQLKDDVKAVIRENVATSLLKVQSFMESVALGGDEVLAPLTAVRLEALDHIQKVITELGKLKKYDREQPTITDFAQINEQLEKKYGFDSGRYNGYTSSNFYNVLATGFVAAELIKLAARSAALRTAEVAVAEAFETAASRVAVRTAGRFIAVRAAGAVVGWGARWLGRVAGPIGWIGSSAMIAYDLKKGYDRKVYRKFLKSFIPEAYTAGAVGYRFAEYSQDVDDKIIDYLTIAEVITTVMLANRLRTISWAEKLLKAESGAARAVRSVTVWGRWARMYEKTHLQVLGAMLSRSASAAGTAVAAGTRQLLTQMTSAKNLWGLFRRNASHVAFISGSVAMAFDSHFVNQGYGHVFWGVPKRAWDHSSNPSDFISSLVNQFKHAFFESPQAQIDIVSISLSDAVLTYGSVNPNLTAGQLGHLYGAVSSVSEVLSQVAIAFSQPGDQQLSEVVEKIDWQRALIHYAFVSTFSTWKHLALYMPIMNKGLRPLLQSQFQQPFLRTMVRAADSEIISRRFAAFAARNMKGSSLWLTRFGLSLGSNWVGNNGFIQIAMTLKKNSADVPPALESEVLGRVQAAFKEMNWDWNEANIRARTAEIQSEIDEIKKMKRDAVIAAAQDLDRSEADVLAEPQQN